MKNKKFSNQFLYFILITLACIFVSLVLVWPLWKFAVTFSRAYTIVLLTLIAAGILYLVINKIRKTPVKKTLLFILNTVIVISGLSGTIFSLLIGKRFIALVVLLLTTAALVLVKFLLNKISKNNKFSK